LLKLDLSNPNPELEVAASIETEARFRKLLWSEYTHSTSHNILLGGSENNKIYLYDYEKILSTRSETGSIVQVLDKHSNGGVGVSALDINPFQTNLLASGAGASDIFIWDLNNPQTPMTPGAKLQPLDDINCLAWNRQVQHILASTSSGKCVVWDLRKNESIIKVSDSMSKMKANHVAWHPDIATQMCLSSDDDNTPFLQLWDLRFATSPVRVLEGHQRGILAFCWSPLDSNLLLSSAKDSRIVCWNPNNATVNGEILYDLPTNSQWCFDLEWSKRHPDLFCASSFEGQTNVYTIMGGKFNVANQTSSKIMDSFGVLGDGVSNEQALAIQQQQQQQQQTVTQTVAQVKLAPKWMKRTCGARFAVRFF
jgi:protein transport protein SEC31